MNRGISYDAFPARHLRTTGLKLRLHQNDRVSIITNNTPDSWKNQFQGNEGHIRGGKRNKLWKGLVRKVARVCLLDKDDPGIISQSLVNLGFPDVDRKYASRAVLKHAIGETTRRSTNVRAIDSLQIDLKFAKCRFEFQTAPAHISRLFAHVQFDIAINAHARLRARNLRRFHIACHDQTLCLLSRRRQSAFHQQQIQPRAISKPVPAFLGSANILVFTRSFQLTRSTSESTTGRL